MSEFRVFMPSIVVVSLGALVATGVVSAVIVVVGLIALVGSAAVATNELVRRYTRHGRRHGHHT